MIAKPQQKHFDQIATEYLGSRSGEKHIAYKRQWWQYIYKKLVRYLPREEEVACLDAMCGNAELSLFLSNKIGEIKIDAFDYSDKMVEAAKDKARGNPKISVIQKDILKLNDKDKYDLVIIAGGLHHVPDNVELVLRSVNSALKPGGVFLNIEPTHNNVLWRIVREKLYRSNDLFDASSERAFRLGDYNALLRQQGFEIVYQNYPGLLGYVLYYNPDAFPKLSVALPISSGAFSKFDLFLGNTWIGKYFSFATWTIARKKC